MFDYLLYILLGFVLSLNKIQAHFIILHNLTNILIKTNDQK
jgi:hypothetical protein